MTTRRGHIGMLALLLTVSITTPALAASPPTQRGLDETFRFSWAGQSIKDGPSPSPADADQQWMAYVEQELNAAKQELLELEGARRAALILYSDPNEDCEREVIERWYNEERSRLQGNIRALRDIRGDRRKLFTKVWHRIGPVGRRVVRAIGDEALTALGSGGLGGGVARRILIRVGRKELKNVVLAGIGRKIQARAAAARGAAEDECKNDEVSADPNAAQSGPSGPIAVKAATYVGALDSAMVTDLLSFDSGRPSVNTFTLVVDETGLVSGRFEVHQEGSFMGCPGRVADWAADISAGQHIGSKLPVDLTLDLDIRDHNVWEHDVGCFDPVPDNEFGTATLRIRKMEGDRLLGVIEGLIHFELERVADE